MSGEATTAVNEYGTPITLRTCTACGRQFSICPADPDNKFGSECLADNCPSYNLARDVDTFFEAATGAGLIQRQETP